MDAAGARLIADLIGEQFRHVHGDMRKEIEPLDADTLNWKPDPEANSIAVLYTHTLGSEKEMLRAVRGLGSDRVRSAEFEVTADARALIALLDLADQDLDEHIGKITAQDLTSMRPRGDRPPRPGLEWLITNYGHAREHLAQAQLTKQLYSARK
jgi:hypothetical protein